MLASDENFDGDILRGMFRRCPDLNVVRVQDVGLSAAPDPEILAWATVEGRILLTHDRDTIPYYVAERVNAGQVTPGVFLVCNQMPIGQAIEEILLAVDCLEPEECINLVKFFPL